MNNTQSTNKHYFRFKQFSVTDQNCGMKIGTDGVLLGAIAAKKKCNNVLDIGTGSGVIALMIAQKQPALIECVEIDPSSFNDAMHNVERSPWSNRIKLFRTSFQEYASFSNKRFDLIVCNPPFFHNSMKASDIRRTKARHSDSLPLNDIFSGVSKLLTGKGCFLIIIPATQYNYVNNLLRESSLYINEEWVIRPNPEKEMHRVVLSGSKTLGETSTLKHEVAIETGVRHQYTQEYRSLTGDYYL